MMLNLNYVGRPKQVKRQPKLLALNKTLNVGIS